MGRFRHVLLIAILVVLPIQFSAIQALARDACPASQLLGPLQLPHLRQAIARGEQAVIVALGSSSTEGAMASTPGRTYPAELQTSLSSSLPDRHVAVVNRGIGGQDAPSEAARLEADVIAVRPQLVVWQVGANATLRDSDPARFRQLVGDGIQRLQKAGIDVVLMDNQRAPRILAAKDGHEFDDVLSELAHATGAGLFSRDLLMLAWEKGGAPAIGFYRHRWASPQ